MNETNVFHIDPPTEDEFRRQRAQDDQKHRAREDRIRALKREIQVARQRMREHDHLLAELRDLERDRLDEMKEIARRNRRPSVPPTGSLG